MEYQPIKNWADDDKPREKLELKGPDALSDAELLAILIATGSREKSAVDLGREVMSLAGNNLNRLGRLGIKDLQKIKGIGAAKAITLAAALELGKRRQYSDELYREKISSSKDASKILLPLMQDLQHEKFCVLYLDQSNKLIAYEFVSSGGVSGTVVDMKMVLRNAVQHLASNIIVAHNHPSGNKTPSASDKSLTRKIKEAAALMDINLNDHLIIAEQSYFSFADANLL